MSIEQPLRQWSITATLDGAGLTFAQGGVEVLASGTAATLSPVEHLLIAAASCLALSIKAAARARQQPFSTVQVEATGAKASKFPSRLGGLSLEVSLGTPLSHPEAEEVLKEAKQLCTVTNTITAPPFLNAAYLAMPVRNTATRHGSLEALLPATSMWKRRASSHRRGAAVKSSITNR